TVLPGLVVALEHGLGAQLDVEKLVARACVVENVDAGADVARRPVLDRRTRLEVRGLTRVADGVRVRDVVTGHVDSALLRQQALEGRLDAEEGRERHQALASTVCAACCVGAQPPGRYPACGEPERMDIRCERNVSSCRTSTWFCWWTRDVSSRRPCSSAESWRACNPSA